MLHGRCGAAQRPGSLAGRQDGALLVARRRLRRPPSGTVARLCPRGSFSHVVAYTRQASALRSTADTLLDAASYGCRWVLLSPAPGGCGPGRTPNPKFGCSSQLPPGHGPRATQMRPGQCSVAGPTGPGDLDASVRAREAPEKEMTNRHVRYANAFQCNGSTGSCPAAARTEKIRRIQWWMLFMNSRGYCF